MEAVLLPWAWDKMCPKTLGLICEHVKSRMRYVDERLRGLEGKLKLTITTRGILIGREVLYYAGRQPLFYIFEPFEHFPEPYFLVF
jgi:hypothetical protein